MQGRRTFSIHHNPKGYNISLNGHINYLSNSFLHANTLFVLELRLFLMVLDNKKWAEMKILHPVSDSSQMLEGLHTHKLNNLQPIPLQTNSVLRVIAQDAQFGYFQVT